MMKLQPHSLLTTATLILTASQLVLAQFGAAAELAKAPLPKNDAEKKVLEVLEVMGKDPSRRYLSVSQADGRLMSQLTEAMGAKTVVEIGTSTGYSGLWFARALLSTGGKLITHEYDADRAEIARKNFAKAGVDRLVTVVQGDAHETVKRLKGPIDVVFIDADKDGYIDYLNQLLPLVRPGGLIFAHNMRRPTPDPRYLKAITTNPDLDTSFVLMDGAGVGITLKKR